MEREAQINIGEVVRDHCGEFVKKYSGDIVKDEIGNVVLNDTTVGLNAVDSYVINFGISSRFPYIYVCYNSKESKAKIPVVRSHAIYTECSWNSLYYFESLLRFSFYNSEKSRDIITGLQSLPQRKNVSVDIVEKEIKPIIDDKLLSGIIIFCIRKIKLFSKKPLYIIVPDSVSDSNYQEYCLSVITIIINSIPLGLRKQFRIATNVDELNIRSNQSYYHIQFCRCVSAESKKREMDCLNLEDSDIPAFILEEVDASSKSTPLLNKLIDWCVSYPQGSTESAIDECYLNFEKYFDLKKIREKDYLEYEEIKEMKDKPLSSSLLKRYDDKLSQNLKPRLKELLENQIEKTVKEGSNLKAYIENAEMAHDLIAFDDLILTFSKYKNLILFIKSIDFDFFDEILQNSIRRIKDNYFQTHQENLDRIDTEKKLDIEKKWKNEIEVNKNEFEKLFGEGSLKRTFEECENTILDYKENYKIERIKNWKNEVINDFSVDNIKKNCEKVRELDSKELTYFCDDLMDGLAASNLPDGRDVVPRIQAILDEEPTTNVDPGLYSICRDELINGLKTEVSLEEINRTYAIISLWFGESETKSFGEDVFSTVTECFNNGCEGNGCCANISINDSKKIKEKLNENYIVPDESRKALEDSVHSYIKNHIERKIDGILKRSDLTSEHLDLIWNDIENEELLDNKTEKRQLKQKEINNIFEYMKRYAEKEEEAADKRSETIDWLYEYISVKDKADTEGFMTSEINTWYRDYSDERKKEEKTREIQININCLLSYLYVCKSEKEVIIDSDGEILNTLLSNYSEKNGITLTGYSFASFLDAIDYIENRPLEAIICSNESSDRETKEVYIRAFVNLNDNKKLPICISKEKDVLSIYREVSLYSKIQKERNQNILLKSKIKKKDEEFESKAAMLLVVLGDLIYVRTKVFVSKDEGYLRASMSKQEEEECVDIWEFLIRAEIVEESDIISLDQWVKNEQDEEDDVPSIIIVKKIIEYYNRIRYTRKAKRTGKWICSVGLGALLLLSSFALGHKLSFINMNRNKSSNTVESMQDSRLEIPISSIVSGAEKNENIESASRVISSDSENNDNSETTKSFVTTESNEKTDNIPKTSKTGKGDKNKTATKKNNKSKANLKDSENSGNAVIDSSTNIDETENDQKGKYDYSGSHRTDSSIDENSLMESEEHIIDSSIAYTNDGSKVEVEEEYLHHGKVKAQNSSNVNIRIDANIESKVIADVANTDDLDVILLESIPDISIPGLFWQKVRFEKDFIDSKGRVVSEGTEAYISSFYIETLD